MDVSGLRTLKTNQSETTRMVAEISRAIGNTEDRIQGVSADVDKLNSQLKLILNRLDKLEKDIDVILNG